MYLANLYIECVKRHMPNSVAPTFIKFVERTERDSSTSLDACQQLQGVIHAPIAPWNVYTTHTRMNLTSNAPNAKEKRPQSRLDEQDDANILTITC
jgi:hypothetical protein